MSNYESASLPLLRAIGTRVTAAMSAEGQNCPFSTNPNPKKPLPYGVLGTDTENDGFSSKDDRGAVMTHTIRIYSPSESQARTLAAIAIKYMMDDSNRLTLESPYYLAGRVGLDLNEVIPERDERGDRFGALIRFRFLIGSYPQSEEGE